MKRNGHDGVKALVARQSRSQQLAQGPPHGLHASVFVQVNPFPEKTLIGTEAVSGVETAQALAA